MDEDPTTESKSNLKTEWSLFWSSLTDKHEIEEDFDSSVLSTMTREQIKEMTRMLSQDRKKVNQKIESLNKEIDLNSAKLETLKLVGGEVENTLQRIHELNDQGQKLSVELMSLDEKLKLAREIELQGQAEDFE